MVSTQRRMDSQAAFLVGGSVARARSGGRGGSAAQRSAGCWVLGTSRGLRESQRWARERDGSAAAAEGRAGLAGWA
jgi:hypothetical protein